MHVAQHLVRPADVLGEEGEEVLVRLAGPEELHGRDLEPFLVDLAGVEAVLGAADVGDVTHHPAERDDLAVAEHRGRNGDVEQVPRAEPRIVRDEHVPGLQGLRRVAFEHRVDGDRQGEVEDWHGARGMHDLPPAGVEDLAREVLRLADDERERGADDGLPALLGDVDHPAPHDLEPHRIGLDPGDRLLERGVGADDDARGPRSRRGRARGCAPRPR